MVPSAAPFAAEQNARSDTDSICSMGGSGPWRAGAHRGALAGRAHRCAQTSPANERSQVDELIGRLVFGNHLAPFAACFRSHQQPPIKCSCRPLGRETKLSLCHLPS